MERKEYKDNIVYNKAYSLAIEIVGLYKILSDNKEYVLSKQILRCGTSIGANIAEANGAISQADFSAKISIAYKEVLETKYWLTLLKDTGYIQYSIYIQIFTLTDEVARILFSILKTTRINKQE